jgi:hypothetical protein
VEKHLVAGLRGSLVARVMYVFDDAVVFVAPPPGIGTEGSSFLVQTLEAIGDPTNGCVHR